MTKQIGIITHHNSYNYGAALQAYATVLFLKDLGFAPQMINYYPEYLQGFGTYRKTFKELLISREGIIKSILFTLIKTPSYKKLKKRFDKFALEKLPLTKAYYSLEELEKDLPNCDVFCSGSDQVWNNYYTHLFDGAYFLDFVPRGKKCFSFASSFGKEKFTVDEQFQLKEKLKKFEYISVREESGVNLVKGLGYDATLMLDPTVLVDTKIWIGLCKKPVMKKPYILVYQLHGDSNTFNVAKTYGKKANIPVISIITMYHQIRPGCKNIIIPTLNEFLGLFRNAEYVFTDSFHGTVYSLLFRKKLAVTLPAKFSNRLTTLLNNLCIDDFIFKDMELWEKMIETVDYGLIQKELCKLRKDKIQEIIKYLSTL